MNKLLKSRKALSPVIASIILVAVTVAVSIAVAAWMGALTFTFTKNDQFNVVTIGFYGATGAKYINMSIQNIGSSPWTLSSTAQVNGVSCNVANMNATGTLTTVAGGNIAVKITYEWVAGNQYSVQLTTTTGTKITYVANAPS
jgi:flagellin-like protein